MKRYDLIIVGGCASGLVAAINAKRLHPRASVAVVEKLPRVGKKLLATGNGRCNLTNLNALEHEYKNRDFALHALKKYPPERIIEFFSSLGLLCRADSEGRVYPRSNAASSVLDALRFEIEKQGVQVICDTTVKTIKKSKNGFILNDTLAADRLIIACGGKSSPSQGADGSGYVLAKTLGHSVTPLRPALSPLLAVDTSLVRSLKGVRANGVRLTLLSGKKTSVSQGEILFTDSGISGIAAMELASSICDKEKTFTAIDLLPEMSERDLTEYIKNVRNIKGERPLDDLLTGFLPKPLGIQICKACNLYTSGRMIKTLSEKECGEISCKVKNFTLEISGAKGFNDSQVTSGGIAVNEIDGKTMSSRLVENLWLAGEIIDVDARCGGFNLQWAWASGLLAGELISGDNYND